MHQDGSAKRKGCCVTIATVKCSELFHSQSQQFSSNFESLDGIQWCRHSNETSLAVHLHGTIYFSIFYKIKFDIFLEYI